MAEKMIGRSLIATSAAVVVLSGCDSQPPQNQLESTPVFNQPFIIENGQNPIEPYLPDIENKLYPGHVDIRAEDIGSEIRSLADACEIKPGEKPVEFGEAVYFINQEAARALAEVVIEAMPSEAAADDSTNAVLYTGKTSDGDLAAAHIVFQDDEVDTIYLDLIDDSTEKPLRVNHPSELSGKTDDRMTTMMLRRMTECQDKEQWVISMSQKRGSAVGDKMNPAIDLDKFLDNFVGVEFKGPAENPYNILEIQPKPGSWQTVNRHTELPDQA